MKVALITGASSGIGAATARKLAAAGYRIVLVARGADRLAEVAAGLPGEPIVEAVDAADGDGVAAMAARVIERVGVPDVIVNSAGAGVWKYIENTSPSEAVSMMNAPYFAAFNVTQAFMTGMLARKSGVIVHVGSPASAFPWTSATGYTAARWALRGLHESLRQDLHGTGVRSCHVVFGKVSSEYFDNNPESEQFIPTIAKTVRTVTPEECAEVIAKVVRRPKHDVRYPFMMKMYYWSYAVMPWLTRWLLRTTGRRRALPPTPDR